MKFFKINYIAFFIFSTLFIYDNLSPFNNENLASITLGIYINNVETGQGIPYLDIHLEHQTESYFYIETTNFNGYAEFKDVFTPVRTDKFPTPEKYDLLQNYPNPFNPSTRIPFDIFKQGHVNIDIYDIQGKKIKILVSADYGPGQYYISWDGSNYHGRSVSAGIYFARMQTEGFFEVIKMVLMDGGAPSASGISHIPSVPMKTNSVQADPYRLYTFNPHVDLDTLLSIGRDEYLTLYRQVLNENPEIGDVNVPASISFGDTLKISFNAVDPDNATGLYDSTYYQIRIGDLVFNSDSASYKPTSPETLEIVVKAWDQYNGADSILTETAVLDTTQENQKPTAYDINASTPEDISLVIHYNATDPEGLPLSYRNITNPNGTLSNAAGDSVTFTPVLNFSGSNAFEYEVTDSGGEKDTANVYIQITPVNDMPVLDPLPDRSSDEDEQLGSFNIRDLVSDVDNSYAQLSKQVSSSNPNLSVSIVGDNVVYSLPTENWHGSSTITVRFTDPGDLFAERSYTHTVNSVNDAPVADLNADDATPDLGQDVDFDATDSYDVDGSIIQYIFRPESGQEHVTSSSAYSYSYSTSGPRNAEVVVIDNEGARDSTYITITVNDAARIANGKVVNMRDNTNIAGVISILYNPNTETELGRDTTDASGNFEIKGDLSTQLCRIEFSHPNYISPYKTGANITGDDVVDLGTKVMFPNTNQALVDFIQNGLKGWLGHTNGWESADIDYYTDTAQVSPPTEEKIMHYMVGGTLENVLTHGFLAPTVQDFTRTDTGNLPPYGTAGTWIFGNIGGMGNGAAVWQDGNGNITATYTNLTDGATYAIAAHNIASCANGIDDYNDTDTFHQDPAQHEIATLADTVGSIYNYTRPRGTGFPDDEWGAQVTSSTALPSFAKMSPDLDVVYTSGPETKFFKTGVGLVEYDDLTKDQQSIYEKLCENSVRPPDKMFFQ